MLSKNVYIYYLLSDRQISDRTNTVREMYRCSYKMTNRKVSIVKCDVVYIGVKSQEELHRQKKGLLRLRLALEERAVVCVESERAVKAAEGLEL